MRNLLVFFLFLITNTYSQNTIEAIYGITPSEGSIENSEKIVKDGMQSVFRGVDKEFANFEFQLLIENNNAQFKFIDKLTTNKIANTIVKGVSDISTYYCNDSISYVQREIASSKFIVKVENKNDWLLSNDSKEIDGYTCFKATKTKLLIDGRTINITAWYTTKIPLHFGPKEYFGLPGLIIELTDDKVTYGLKKVIFDSKKSIDFKIANTKIYSDQEFKKVSEEFFENSKKMILKE